MKSLLEVQKELGVIVNVVYLHELIPVVGFAKGTEIMQNLWRCGGFQTTFLTEQSRQQAADCALTEAQKAEILLEPIGPRICVLGKLADRLSDKTAAAALAHEYGHVYYKHIGRELVDAGVGIFSTLELELEADAFAASFVGKTVVKDAINEILRIMLDMIREAPGIDEATRQLAIEDQLRINNSELIQARLTALSS